MFSDPIRLNDGFNLYQYAPNTTGWIDSWGWITAPSTLPNTLGVYTITNGSQVYVGSAGGGTAGMNQRMSTGSHSSAQALLNQPGTTVSYREVDLGSAATRAEREHILRHFEQQEIDAQKAAGKQVTNQRAAEATSKNARNAAEVQKHGASQEASKSC